MTTPDSTTPVVLPASEAPPWLCTTGAFVLILNTKKQVLFVQRADNGLYELPGGEHIQTVHTSSQTSAVERLCWESGVQLPAVKFLRHVVFNQRVPFYAEPLGTTTVKAQPTHFYQGTVDLWVYPKLVDARKISASLRPQGDDTTNAVFLDTAGIRMIPDTFMKAASRMVAYYLIHRQSIIGTDRWPKIAKLPSQDLYEPVQWGKHTI